jgi:hypothetical protein
MQLQEKLKPAKTSNFPEQRFLSEMELLILIEQHYNGRPAARIYVAPMCYILPEFYEQALQGMLGSFEAKEEYEACAKVIKLLANI